MDAEFGLCVANVSLYWRYYVDKWLQNLHDSKSPVSENAVGDGGVGFGAVGTNLHIANQLQWPSSGEFPNLRTDKGSWTSGLGGFQKPLCGTL